MSKGGALIYPGVIDAGYTGTLKVMADDLSPLGATFSAGIRIAQLLILPVLNVELKEGRVSHKRTERRDSGLGSSGK